MNRDRAGTPKRKATSSWPIGYRFAAVGTLVIYTAIGTTTVAIGNAQPPNAQSAAPASISPTSPPVRRFDIPAGPLGTAVALFERQSGMRVDIDKAGMRELESPGVSGEYTVKEALERLVRGTGITVRTTSASTVRLELAGPNNSIDVVGRPEPSSPKYTEPLVNVPQTVTLIPQQLMQQQGATSLRDVLQNVSGLTLTAGEGGAPAGDNLTLRGFSARNDIFVDGVRDLGPQSRDPFNVEQVEVVKGPASSFTGRGSTGGIINLVSKAPMSSRVVSGSALFGTSHMKRGTLDLNTPVGALGERTAFRLNLMAHESGVPGRDITENQRWGIAPALTFGLGSPTRLTLSYLKVDQDNLPDYGIPWVPNTTNVLREYRDQPAPVPRETFYGIESRDYERTGSDLGTIRVEHDFSDNLRFRDQLRYGRSTRDSVTSAPRFASPDSLTINRNGPAWLTEDQVWDNQTDLTLRVGSGRVQHDIVGGLMLSREANIRKGRTVAPAPQTTLFNPNPNDPYSGPITINSNIGDLAANSQALYAFDTLKFGQRWQVNGGARWDRFAVSGVNTSGVRISRVDQMPSLRGALLFKPAANGTLYASAGTSMNPSLEGLSYQPADATLEPEKTYTVEVGTKWDLLQSRLSVTGALFRVEKTNARTPGVSPDDPPQVLNGRQRVQGIELSATGSLSRNWSVFGGYTMMASRILESNTAEEIGSRMLNTPRHSLNVWTMRQVGRLQLGGGVRIVGERYGNNANTRKVDAYWTADAMVSHPLGSHVDLRLNLYNLNNAYYFERLGGGHLVPGAARSAMLGAYFRF
jgi:catecholate siderophore receptor